MRPIPPVSNNNAFKGFRPLLSIPARNAIYQQSNPSKYEGIITKKTRIRTSVFSANNPERKTTKGMTVVSASARSSILVAFRPKYLALPSGHFLFPVTKSQPQSHLCALGGFIKPQLGHFSIFAFLYTPSVKAEFS